MIQFEYLNEGTLIRHYSDLKVLLLQNETGAKYSDPIDIVPCPFTYSETDEPIDEEVIEDDDSQLKALAYDIVTGEEE